MKKTLFLTLLIAAGMPLLSFAQKAKKEPEVKQKPAADTTHVVKKDPPRVQKKTTDSDEESNGILSVRRSEGKWKLTIKVFGNEYTMTN